jgi:FdhE protein
MPEIIRDGSLAGAIPSIPQFRVVPADTFSERAGRLRLLARGHALEEYLRFAAALSDAQDAVLRQLPELPLPAPAVLAQARAHGMPPLAAEAHVRDPAWHGALLAILAALQADALPAQARIVVRQLASSPRERLEAAADALLAGAYAEADAGFAPFVGAALQVYWTRLALQLGETGFAQEAPYGVCPVCGSCPAAGAVRVGGAAQGLRYLACSLCASEWHVVRVKCSACASTAGISYLGIEGAKDSVKAEVCGGCKTYLKVFYLERDPAIVPAADDLATLALDMLVFEQGYHRLGPNFLLAPGVA